MLKFRNKVLAFVAKLDFEDALKDVSDDLKKASLALWSLWLLSYVSRLPGVFGALPKILGLDAQAMQTSAWVSWLLFCAASAVYVLQVALRVRIRKTASCAKCDAPSATPPGDTWPKTNATCKRRRARGRSPGAVAADRQRAAPPSKGPQPPQR